MLELGFVGFMLVVGVGMVALVLWLNRKREQRLRAWAAAVGWRYVGADHALTRRWRSQPFGTGHSRRAHEVVVGQFRGRPAMSFAYTYRTGSGKSESSYTFHVIAVALPAYLSHLELQPEGLAAKLAKTFGTQDIQFESDDFNRAWLVQASNPKFAHDVLHPRTMERLLRPDARGFSFRIEGTDLLLWSSGTQRLDLIAPRLEVASAVIDAIPRFVWQDHGYDPERTTPRPGSSGGPSPAGRRGGPPPPPP